jgi:hypothetical protein
VSDRIASLIRYLPTLKVLGKPAFKRGFVGDGPSLAIREAPLIKAVWDLAFPNPFEPITYVPFLCHLFLLRHWKGKKIKAISDFVSMAKVYNVTLVNVALVPLKKEKAQKIRKLIDTSMMIAFTLSDLLASSTPCKACRFPQPCHHPILSISSHR